MDILAIIIAVFVPIISLMYIVALSDTRFIRIEVQIERMRARKPLSAEGIAALVRYP